jgi:transcriptional regulator GlxA family with amidase domain
MAGIGAAIAHIDRHFTKRLTVAQLARIAGLSLHHFIRAFHAETGETPHQYIRARRLDRAADLLVRTATPVTEIAEQIGFQSAGSFSRIFRARFGEPPSAYRNKRRRDVYIPDCFVRMYRVGR